MRLHVVCRCHGGENAKGRPAYYSKHLALASLAQAVRRCPPDRVELLFVCDGPVPASLHALMTESGEVLRIDKGSNRGSYLWSLGLPRRRRWAGEDLVLFAEDDYLYRPEALVELLRAADSEREAAYLFPYAEVPEEAPGPWSRWVPHPSTTSTFAVRVATMRRDEHVLRIGPFTGGAWDHASCLAVGGQQPYDLRGVLRHDPAPAGTSPARRVARAAALTATKAGLAAMVWQRGRRGLASRTLAAVPPLATHLEDQRIAWGTDWASLAAQVAAAEQRPGKSVGASHPDGHTSAG